MQHVLQATPPRSCRAEPANTCQPRPPQARLPANAITASQVPGGTPRCMFTSTSLQRPHCFATDDPHMELQRCLTVAGQPGTGFTRHFSTRRVQRQARSTPLVTPIAFGGIGTAHSARVTLRPRRSVGVGVWMSEDSRQRMMKPPQGVSTVQRCLPK
ncbi:hypothetical protein ABBQ32_013414 [Trebouxia sp. C0010 RCD-2024]